MLIDSLRTYLTNDPLFKTYFQPYQAIPCRSPNSFSLIYLLPNLIQASLLYPHLNQSKWIRSIRLLITPFSIYYSLRLPIDYCFNPNTRRGYPNLALACTSFTMMARSIHWGTLDNFKQAKIFKRPEFQPQSPEPLSFSFSDWLAWTIELVSSPRGIQYEWGVKAKPNRESAMQVIQRMYKLNLIHVLVTAFSILCRDHQRSPSEALNHLGLGKFYGQTILAEALASLAFGYYLVTMIELTFGYLTLLIHLLNLIHSRLIKLPKWLIRSCDLRTCVPLFNSPHTASSLAHLWGKAWHQNFRQSFLICGGTPISKLAKALGLNPQLQRLAGMSACFLISAILHEYAIHFIARQPHPSAHILFHDFPGSAIYFLLQPIGIVLEPYLVPYIPGGGIVWVYLFTLFTTIPFRRQYFMPARLLDDGYPSLSTSWILSSLLIPGFTSRG